MTERSLEIFGRFILGKEQAVLANVIPHHQGKYVVTGAQRPGHVKKTRLDR